MPINLFTRGTKRKIDEPAGLEPGPARKASPTYSRPPPPRKRIKANGQSSFKRETRTSSRIGDHLIDLTGEDPTNKVTDETPSNREARVIGVEGAVDRANTNADEYTITVQATTADASIQVDRVLTVDVTTQVNPAMLEPPALPHVYNPDPKYFFVDGDIIIRTESTLFRVHRERLAAVEGLFGELASLPQPEDCEKLDGVPVCDMFNLVTATEVHYLLGLIYDDIVLKKLAGDKSPCLHWNGSLAILNASHKLDLPTMRRSAIDALQLLFPCDISAYHPERPIIICGINPQDREQFTRLFPLQAINAFRTNNVPALMPMAYYLAAQLSIEDIVNGVLRANGDRETISAFDITKVLEGRERLRGSRRSTVFGWLDNLTPDGKPNRPCDACDNVPLLGNDTCFYYLLRMSMDFNRNGFLDTKTEALEALPEVSLNILKKHLCEHCWIEVQRRMRTGLNENWRRMPTYFGLASWDNLISAQAKEDSAWGDI